jgi:uncharacterized membrane protein HdeD (DUF308 family)
MEGKMKKRKVSIIASSLIEIAAGVLGIVACILMASQNETTIRCVITLVVALLFLVLGGMNLFDYLRQKENSK